MSSGYGRVWSLQGRCLQRPLEFGRFRRGINVKPEVDAWIAAQRLNRLAQAAIASATAAWAILLDRYAVIGNVQTAAGVASNAPPAA